MVYIKSKFFVILATKKLLENFSGNFQKYFQKSVDKIFCLVYTSNRNKQLQEVTVHIY